MCLSKVRSLLILKYYPRCHRLNQSQLYIKTEVCAEKRFKINHLLIFVSFDCSTSCSETNQLMAILNRHLQLVALIFKDTDFQVCFYLWPRSPGEYKMADFRYVDLGATW